MGDVIEMNSDAQMCQLLRLHVPDRATQILPANHSDGMPLTARWITGFVAAACDVVLEKDQ